MRLVNLRPDGRPVSSGLDTAPVFGLPTLVNGHCTANGVRNVLVVSNSRLLREALQRDLPRTYAGFERVEAASRDDAGDRIVEFDPDVAILDSSTAEMAALPPMLRVLSPHLRIVVLTATGSEAEFVRWAELGVQGYVDQDSSTADLVAVINLAARGEIVCSSRLAGLLVSRVASLSAERNKGRDVTALTPREKQVLGLLADGLSNRRIASRLQITEATAKNHVHRILDKLGLHSRGEAAAYYVRHRL